MTAPLFNRSNTISTLATYHNDVSEVSQTELQKAYEDAKIYNDMLFQTMGYVFPDIDEEILSDAHYHELLDLSGTSVMGRIEIPKINVDLPIYHGTDEEALSNGIGHLQGSSLPVGGINTRSILSGHRGTPNAKLFLRLDELKIGDLVYVEILDQTLAYQVTDTDIIDPEDYESLVGLDIMPDKDILTLVTCTPYAINTHRLIVNCERVEYIQQDKDDIEQALPSMQDMSISYGIPIILFVLAEEIAFQFPICHFIKGLFKPKEKGAGKNES